MQLKQTKVKFTSIQLRTIIACYIAYTAAYIGRLNFAEALPAISSSCGFTSTQLGILQTVFAVTYASGQLIIGSLADRHKPLTFVLTGLLGTAIFNFSFGLVRSYELMLLIWMFNGISQSMLWTPIMRLVAKWFDGPARSKACFIMSAATIVGHLLSWVLAAYLSARFSWSVAFFVPGALLFVVFILTAVLLKDDTSENKLQLTKKTHNGPRMSFMTLLFSTGLSAILITCIVNGFVRDGITTWSPSILSKAFGEDNRGSFFSLIIPVINIFGWAFSQLCFKKMRGGARPSIVVFMVSCAVVCGVTFVIKPSSVIVLACALGISCAIMYGNTPLLTAMLPMEYASANRVALVAGMIDSFIYLGSALSGMILGQISDANGSIIYLILALSCVIGAVFAAISTHFKKNIEWYQYND